MQAKYKAMLCSERRLGYSTLAGATDLTIHLNGTQPVSRKTVQYQCDAKGAAMGLPATAFPVEYINGAGNSLAVVPVHGVSLIFANVSSASAHAMQPGNISGGTQPDRLTSTPIRSQARRSPPAIGSTPSNVKSLSNLHRPAEYSSSTIAAVARRCGTLGHHVCPSDGVPSR